MFVIGNNALGEGGFVPPANTGDILTATGYPATLIKTLKKKIESITVYGAEGGVGDKMINLFNPNGFKITTANINSDGYINRGTGATFEIEIEANTQYTFVASKKIASLGGYYFSYGFSENRHTAAGDGIALYPFERLSSNVFLDKRTVVVTSPANANYLYVVIGNDRTGDTYDKKFMLVEGSYTDSDAPDYEPCGYRIPIIVSGNLYDISSYPLTTGKYVNGGNGIINNNSSYAVTNYIPCEHLQGKTVTLNKRLGRDANYPGIAFFSDEREYVAGEPNGNSRLATWTFTVPNNSHYMRFTVLAGATDIMLNYGSTELPYEPYAVPKTYHVNSDVPLYDTDRLEIDPKATAADRYRAFTRVDVRDIQDWTQDFKLAKADTLTVTTGTTVAPSGIEVRYWSKAKEETG
ncbi:MAG: hypothetical protein IJH37_12945 [Clostridia bacterium]|nr:hypothetical protein [Clostridia bacterium]